MRVVSLVPSVTETLLEWGVEPVACTRFCEQPDLRHVGGTKNPDIDAIVALAPDLVVVEREENRLEDHEALVAAGLDVEVLHIVALSDVASEIGRLAARVGADWEPPIPEPVGATLRAFVPIWRRPYMTISDDTYGGTMLTALGVSNVFGSSEIRYPEVTAADITERHPDVVLAPTEPYPFRDEHRSELDRFGPTLLIDGQDLFWWGTRTGPAMERVAAALRSAGPGR